MLLAAVGGLLTETAFPGRSWWFMAYIGVAVLLVALRTPSIRLGALSGLAFGLGLFLPHLWWANVAVGSPIGWIALSVAQGSAIGIFGASVIVARRLPGLRTQKWVNVVVVPVLWVAVEHLRGSFPFGGFPWGALAYSQTDAPLLGLAPVGGSTLVGLVVVLVAVLLAALVTGSGGRGRVRSIIVLLSAGTAALGPGVLSLPTAPQSGELLVGAVQGNVPVAGAAAMSQAREVLDNHAAGTAALVERSGPDELDLLVWPESSTDIDPRTDARARAVVEEATRLAGAPLLLGTQRFTADTRYNDYVLWEPSRGATDLYTKQHPVPFGEYIPYRSFFRSITTAVDLVGTDMIAGTDPTPISVPIERLQRDVPISIGICFEVAYDDLIRTSVLAGGELIVIPTNNASFGMTEESTQQLAMSRFRAAEHGRAVVQISTVGVSAAIAPDGSVLDRTSLFTAAQMVKRLPLRTSLTTSDRIGDRLALSVDGLALLLVAGGLLFSVVRWSGSRGAPQQTRDQAPSVLVTR